MDSTMAKEAGEFGFQYCTNVCNDKWAFPSIKQVLEGLKAHLTIGLIIKHTFKSSD